MAAALWVSPPEPIGRVGLLKRRPIHQRGYNPVACIATSKSIRPGLPHLVGGNQNALAEFGARGMELSLLRVGLIRDEPGAIRPGFLLLAKGCLQIGEHWSQFRVDLHCPPPPSSFSRSAWTNSRFRFSSSSPMPSKGEFRSIFCGSSAADDGQVPVGLLLEYLLDRCPPVFIEMIGQFIQELGGDAIPSSDGSATGIARYPGSEWDQLLTLPAGFAIWCRLISVAEKSHHAGCIRIH